LVTVRVRDLELDRLPFEFDALSPEINVDVAIWPSLNASHTDRMSRHDLPTPASPTMRN
jgi:hypothetical protein